MVKLSRRSIEGYLLRFGDLVDKGSLTAIQGIHEELERGLAAEGRVVVDRSDNFPADEPQIVAVTS